MATIYRAKCPHADLRIVGHPKSDGKFPCLDCSEPVAVERWEMTESVVWRVVRKVDGGVIRDGDEAWCRDWVKRNPMYCLDRGLVLRRIVKRTLRKARP